jgi:hypothetical protein
VLAAEQLEHAQALGHQYDIACTSIRRMLTLNMRHADHAWRRRRRDPIAPYALALLFATPTGRLRHGRGLLTGDDWTGCVEVRAASRIWLDGPETQDLPDMLFRLECQVSDHHGSDGWQLREQLATSVDDGITTEAVWVGVGVSSLDTPTGVWAQTADLALTGAHVPGTIRLIVNVAPPGATPEQGWIVVERRGLGDYNAKTVYSSHRLSSLDLNAPFPYGLTRPADMITNPWHEAVLRRLYGLDAALRAAGHFTCPLGRPAKGTLWRRATDHPTGRQP